MKDVEQRGEMFLIVNWDFFIKSLLNGNIADGNIPNAISTFESK